MGQVVTQGSAANLVVALTDPSGVLLPGVGYGSLTCMLTKDGGTPSAKTLNSGNWTELGAGYYALTVSSGDTDTVGPLEYTLSGASIADFAAVATVKEPAPAPAVASLLTSVMTGHVCDLSGAPAAGVAVSAKLLGTSAQAKVGVSLCTKSIETDEYGAFSLELVRFSPVEVQIPAIGFRRRLTVPNLITFDLFAVS